MGVEVLVLDTAVSLHPALGVHMLCRDDIPITVMQQRLQQLVFNTIGWLGSDGEYLLTVCRQLQLPDRGHLQRLQERTEVAEGKPHPEPD